MTFQPILPTSGLTGWKLLQRTKEVQLASFEKSPEQQRDLQYFRDNIASIQTPEDLVGDRRLLKVALGAFGLSSDINNSYFIKTILQEGVASRAALANKLTDPHYKELAEAFAFDRETGPATSDPSFAERIASRYVTQSFEEAVGLQDNTIRLAMNAERSLAELANSEVSDNAKWYSVMGSEPLRLVFETALGLPDSFGELDIDKQLEVFRAKTDRITGNGEVAQFGDEANLNKLVERYLLMSQLEDGLTMSSSQIAITLLQS